MLVFDSFLNVQNPGFDVFFIGETWLKSPDIQFFNINGYTSVFSNREHKHGGGVCCFIKNGLAYDILLNETFDDSNILIIRVHKIGIVCGFYRAPQTKIESFLNRLETIMHENKKIIFLGDINVDLWCTSNSTSNYKNFITSMNYFLVNKVDADSFTYHCSNHSSILDHIFHNFNNSKITFSVSPVSFSNHCVIAIAIKCKMHVQMKSSNSKIINYDDLIEKIYSIDYMSISYNSFITQLNSAISDCTTIRTINSKNKKRNLWISKEAIDLIRKREALKAKHCKDIFNEELKNEYLELKKQARQTINKCRIEYFNEQFDENRDDNRNLWKNINYLLYNKLPSGHKTIEKLCVNGLTITDGLTIAEAFSTYFSNVATNLTEKQNILFNNKARLSNSNLCTHVTQSLFLYPVTEEEVRETISNVKNKIAPGPNGIAVNTFKICVDALVPIYTHYINEAFTTGSFPTSIQIANITPIFKRGNALEVANYRPIANLDIDSKFFERCIYNRLINFFEKQQCIHSSQFGFLHKSNTTAACLNLVTNIQTSVNAKKITAVLLLDISSAFECVYTEILFQKLETMGIRGKPLDLLKSYFSNRIRRVKIGSFISEASKILDSVPQGSILGPLFFNAYVNDIFELPLKGKLQLYADDAGLSYSCDTLEELYEQMCHDLKVLNEYMFNNFLSLNANKSFYIIFSATGSLHFDNQIFLNNVVIEQKAHGSYLGLEIDENMKWDIHVSNVASKLASYVGAFGRVARTNRMPVLKNLYYSFIHSHILYLTSIWCNAPKYCLQKIQTLQNRAIR